MLTQVYTGMFQWPAVIDEGILYEWTILILHVKDWLGRYVPEYVKYCVI